MLGKYKFRLPALLVLVGGLFLNCHGIKLESHWRNHEITIDGDASDWENALYLIKDKNIDIGVMNDDQFLYICVSHIDRRTFYQAAARGLTLWLKPEHRDKIGIKYPVGIQGDEGTPMMEFEPDSSGSRPNFDRQKFMDESLWEMAVIGADGFILEQKPVNTYNLNIRIYFP